MTTLVKKISVATVFGTIKADIVKALKDSGDKKFVGRFYGMATGSETGVTQFGPWVGLTGAFEGVNAETGEVFSGPKLLLPMGLCERVVAGMAENGSSSATVAVDIYIKHRVIANEDKYEYLAELVGEQGESPLAYISKALPPMPHMKALAAPVAGEKEAEKSPAKKAK